MLVSRYEAEAPDWVVMVALLWLPEMFARWKILFMRITSHAMMECERQWERVSSASLTNDAKSKVTSRVGLFFSSQCSKVIANSRLYGSERCFAHFAHTLIGVLLGGVG